MDHDIQTDVAIVGGGLAGVLCAKRLQECGVDCVLLEADRICNGVTRNTTAKITSQHGAVYSKLIQMFGVETARAYWRANEAALDALIAQCVQIDCDLERKDNYLYTVSSMQTLEQEMQALDQAGIAYDFESNLQLPFPTAGAVCFRNQAQFHPLKFVSGIVNGLRIFENTRVQKITGNMVLTERGNVRASKIIVATHFPIVDKHGAYFLKMYQQRSYVLALENAQQVDGMYLDASGKGLSFRNQGDLLLLGGGSHRTGKKGTGWEELVLFAREHYPHARELCRWATQDCMTLDGIPYIGRYSKATPDLYVATGFNKWGMTSSMVAAMILSDQVQGIRNEYEAFFAPRRRMIRTQLLCNGVESAVNLLTPTRPRCPHLGCALKWNPYEHSWDCPCHGSRFDAEGRLMDNPAEKGIFSDADE